MREEERGGGVGPDNFWLVVDTFADSDQHGQCCGSGIRCLFDPWIREGRKSASGSGIRDEQPGSYFLELRNHFFAFLGFKYLNSLMRIRDGDSSDPGSGMEKIPIRDKHPGSATLSMDPHYF